MLDRLTQYLPENQHLAKLLATYEMPKSSDKSESKDYFLVFECADSTLKELWTKDPEGLMAHQEVAKWVASQSQVWSPSIRDKLQTHGSNPYRMIHPKCEYTSELC